MSAARYRQASSIAIPVFHARFLLKHMPTRAASAHLLLIHVGTVGEVIPPLEVDHLSSLSPSLYTCGVASRVKGKSQTRGSSIQTAM